MNQVNQLEQDESSVSEFMTPSVITLIAIICSLVLLIICILVIVFAKKENKYYANIVVTLSPDSQQEKEIAKLMEEKWLSEFQINQVKNQSTKQGKKILRTQQTATSIDYRTVEHKKILKQTKPKQYLMQTTLGASTEMNGSL